MQRNSVAKPLILIDTVIFFLGLDGGFQEPRGIKGWQYQGHGDELSMPVLSFSIPSGIYLSFHLYLFV